MTSIKAYDHTSFTVSDLGSAVQFWRDAMGFDVHDVSPRTQAWLGEVVGVPGATCQVAHLSGHGLHLEFIAYDAAFEGDSVFGATNRPGAAHLAFVVDDVHSFVGRMLEHGAKPLGKIVSCDGGHADGCLATYIKDPNGVIVELVEGG